MIKRKEIADPTSCLNRAADDEPLFVLRAHDINGSHMVRVWANSYASRNGGVGRLDERQLAKYNSALETAQDMENWRRLHRNDGPR